MTEIVAGTRVVFLMGPTGSGKTRIALDLAAMFPIEIVSVDSALVYRGLDIGTAKPNPDMRRRVPHHLIDICDPAERYSAGRFRVDALAAIDAIVARGRLPLLVGGTGLYFRSLEAGIADLPAADPSVRRRLHAELDAFGSAHLHARLASVDLAAARRIHRNDPQRLVRALEVHALTGQSISELWQGRASAPLSRPIVKIIVAPAERAVLHRRLAARFEAMLERGLVNEVRVLRRRGDLSLVNPALRTVGYRDVWRHLDGEVSREVMLDRSVVATRQLAKRQLTWLRREAHSTWLDSEDVEVGERIGDLLRKRAIFNPCGYDLE